MKRKQNGYANIKLPTEVSPNTYAIKTKTLPAVPSSASNAITVDKVSVQSIMGSMSEKTNVQDDMNSNGPPIPPTPMA